MHYLNFIDKDKSWNDSLKVNQYLFFERYFWIIVNELQAKRFATYNSQEELFIPDGLHDNLVSFSSNINGLVQFLERYLNWNNKLTGEEISYFLTVDKSSRHYDTNRMNAIHDKICSSDIDSTRIVNTHDAKAFTSNLPITYSLIVSRLDDNIRVLDEIMEDESENTDTWLLQVLWQLRDDLTDNILNAQTIENNEEETSQVIFPISYVTKLDNDMNLIKERKNIYSSIEKACFEVLGY